LFCFVCLFFCWHLLIVKILSFKSSNKKKNEKIPILAESRTRLVGFRNPVISPLSHERLLVSFEVNCNTYFFLRAELPISIRMLVFFLEKWVRNAVKTVVVDRKNQKALALLYLASKSLRKAANSSGVPTEFEQNRRGKFELFA